jgi:hypothetical protein
MPRYVNDKPASAKFSPDGVPGSMRTVAAGKMASVVRKFKSVAI